MYAFGLALVKLGLDVQVTHLIDHNYWPNEPARAPMIHLTSAMILTARGPEQQAQGVTNALAYINVALAIGAVGRPHSGFGTLTGQGNGQGGREHGQKADQLPGYRRIENAANRRHMAAVWNVPESEIPHAGKSAFELLDALGTEVHALLIMGSNPAVSAPDALRVGKRLASLDTLVVADFFRSETTEHADIVLPSAQWAEEGGTMTNLEGRVIRRRRAIAPPSGVRTDLEILSAIAAALGRGRWFQHADEAEVFDELRRATAGAAADYAGITYARIEREDGVFGPARPSRVRAHRAFSPTGSPLRPVARASMPRPTPTSPTCATSSFRCCSRRGVCSPSTSQAIKHGAAPSCRRYPANPSRRSTRSQRHTPESRMARLCS